MPRAEERGGGIDRPVRVIRAVVADQGLAVFRLRHGRRLLARFVLSLRQESRRLAIPAWTMSSAALIATSAGTIVCISLLLLSRA
jgi:hypothetical protein